MGRLNIVVVDPSEIERRDLGVEQNGVIVKEVGEGSARDAGIRSGDLILQINNSEVKGLKQFERLVEKLPAGKTIPILIQRRGNPIFMAMKVPPKA